MPKAEPEKRIKGSWKGKWNGMQKKILVRKRTQKEFEELEDRAWVGEMSKYRLLEKLNNIKQ